MPMNRELLVSAIGNVSDRFIEEYSSFVGAARRNLSLKKILLAAACLGIALAVVIASLALNKARSPESVWVSLADIEGVSLENASFSRTGSFVPITNDCWESQLTEKELRRFFGRSGIKLFEEEGASAGHTVLRKGDGSVHTVRLTWSFEHSYVRVTLDPSNAHFFQNDDAVVTVNGYEMVVIRNLLYSNGEIDVIAKKGQTGIWIVGIDENEKEIEKILNFLLNTELDFDAL